MDFFDKANSLRVVDVWQAGNETGWVTPPVLYNPAYKVNGKSMAPYKGAWHYWLLHGTAGTNTLRFWGQGGSIANGTWTLATFLVPKDITVYADNVAHDTRNIVFKMIPDEFACNHAGTCAAGLDNTNSRGVEHESLQNGTHDMTLMGYVKSALLYSHDAALYHIPDWHMDMHGVVATDPVGRRSDPYAGLFDIAFWWSLVTGIRADKRVFDMWGLAQPVSLGALLS